MGLMTIENFYISPFLDDEYDEFSDWKILGKTNAEKLEFIGNAQKQLARKMDEGDLFFTMFTNETLGEKDKLGEKNQ